jgi:DNA-binding response OmpR family regulator
MAILVVEDDAEVSQCVRHLLRTEGFTVDAAADGEAALDYLRTHSAPNLVILDLGLPRIDGASLRRRMLETPEWAAIPVIILSAEKKPSAELRAVDLIRKPFSVEELLHAVQNRAVTVSRAEHNLRGVLRTQR